jgi:hypothetical protein
VYSLQRKGAQCTHRDDTVRTETLILSRLFKMGFNPNRLNKQSFQQLINQSLNQ